MLDSNSHSAGNSEPLYEGAQIRVAVQSSAWWNSLRLAVQRSGTSLALKGKISRMQHRLLLQTICISLGFVCVSCDGPGGRYIAIHYAGGSPEFRGGGSGKKEVQLDAKDASIPPAKRITQLEKDLARVRFISSAGGRFESPINFNVSKVTFEEALRELMKATDSTFSFKFQRTPTQRVSIRSKSYFPEEILEKIADFYGYAPTYDGSTVVFYDKHGN
ncbi:MAG: hypothetical protein IAE97_02745 [Chthoniobacterales bacterium]|nr:hypothetical protein [Chthoniobacterales bacterium]